MIDVVGIGAEGWSGLSAASQRVLTTAQVVIGNDRQLALLDDSVPAERRLLPSPMRPNLDAFLANLGGADVVFLASGDPLVSGIGSTLVRKLGAEKVRVHPQVSSAALARARMGWPWDECEVVTVVGNTLDRLRRYLYPGARIVLLVARPNTPQVVRDFLADAGYRKARITVLEELGTDSERVYELTPKITEAEVVRLYLLAIECSVNPEGLSLTPGLPDSVYRSSQVTKRFVRAAVLALLRPVPGETLWDLGAGSGSISIEWCRQHPRNRAFAVEMKAERAQALPETAAALGVAHQITVVAGDSLASLAELPAPSAVFVGGGLTLPTLAAAISALPVGGRVVANSVTIQTDSILFEAERRWGGELHRLSAETATKIGDFSGFVPARSVTIWAYPKESA